MLRRVVLALVTLAGLAAVGAASGAAPDGSFGQGGYVLVDSAVPLTVGKEYPTSGMAVAAAPGARTLAGGYYGSGSGGRWPFFARLKPNGDLDGPFHDTDRHGGRAYPRAGRGGSVEALVVDRKGRPVAAGPSDGSPGWFVLRFLRNGMRDKSFGTLGVGGGGFTPHSLVFDPRGRLFVGGAGDRPNGAQVARFTPNGLLDTRYGDHGFASAPFDDGAGFGLGPGGSAYVTVDGTTAHPKTLIGVARFRPDGSLDHSWGTDGLASVDLGHGDQPLNVGVLADGSALVAGRAGYVGNERGNPPRIVVVKFTPTGQLDTHFGQNGVAAIASAINLDPIQASIDATGLVVVVGNRKKSYSDYEVQSRFLVALGADGRAVIPVTVLDTRVGDYTGGIAVRPDGAVLVTGRYQDELSVVRVEPTPAELLAGLAPAPFAAADAQLVAQAQDAVAHGQTTRACAPLRRVALDLARDRSRAGGLERARVGHVRAQLHCPPK